MRLKSISLENFRSYKERLLIENFPPISILIGRNNAGKSNLIKALHWYRSMAAAQEVFSVKLLHSANRNNPLVIEVQFVFSEQERQSILDLLTFRTDEIRIAMANSRFLREVTHQIRFDPDGVLFNETICGSNFGGDWVELWGFKREKHQQVKFWVTDVEFQCRRLTTVQDIVLVRSDVSNQDKVKRAFEWQQLGSPLNRIGQLMREYLNRTLWMPPSRYAAARIGPSQDALVEPTGSNLLRVLHSLHSEEPERYPELMKEVYEIIPDLVRITAPMRGTEVAGIIREKGDVEVEFDEAGSGLQQSLILVFNLLLRPTNWLFLVEEPEINLNAAAQRSLFRLIKKLSDNGNQFFITTHSTIFTESSKKVATFLLDKKAGISSIRRLQDPDELRSLKQALGHENTDLFGFNAVLIIEGETEEKCMPLLATGLGLDLSKLGIKLLSIGGTGTSTRIDELLKYLKDSDTVPFIMLDNHLKAAEQRSKWVANKLVNDTRAFVLEKQFEDCFSDDVLIASVSAVAKLHGAAISLSPSALQEYRTSNPSKSIIHFIQNKYYEQSGHTVSKSELGTKIGETLLSKGARDKLTNEQLTQPEIVLRTIKESLKLRQ